MDKIQAVKSITNKIKEEFGDIDFSELNPEDIADTFRILKVCIEVKKLDKLYSVKCDELETTFSKEQQEAFYKFEWLLETLSPKQLELLHEIEKLKEKTLKLNSIQAIS